MNRRDFLRAGFAAGGVLPAVLVGGAAPGAAGTEPWKSEAPPGGSGAGQFDRFFLPILAGYLGHAKATDPTYAVCDFPDGSMLKSCMTPSGRTYVSTARMLPALAAWTRGGRDGAPVRTADGANPGLRDVLLSVYRHAFDPAHPHFWGEANPRKADQRQVEASLAAHALWNLGDEFLGELTSQDRANVQAWLASCTRVPEHKHNHAWFSAVNQASRLSLAQRWPEFSGDAEWMVADLRALDAMAIPGGGGWYNDYPGYCAYDWYNFWTYASHFLLWNEIAGDRFPEWRGRFAPRLAEFLENAPSFFGGNGSSVLFGRSLIYRWAAVTPLVLAYMQGMWPHSPGLLRRIVRRNLEFFWDAGAFDADRGKLRETLASGASPAIRERYIDNGHPYWCMQAFALFRLPADDPFWTAEEEPLPVERGDYRLRFPGLGMTLVGTRSSGQVRWLQSRNNHKAPYRDKYIKSGYSSHFPFNVIDDPKLCPWDQALVFRDRRTGETVGRGEARTGELLADGSLLSEWTATLGGCTFEITSRVRLVDEFEERFHTVRSPAGAVGAGVEILEGSYSLGLADGEEPETESGPAWAWLRHPGRKEGILVVRLAGYTASEITRSFGAVERSHVLYPRMALHTLRASIESETLTLGSLHYASPRPRQLGELLAETGLTRSI